jgi:ubiquinone/menaquinone biosynthesis C-methylase UbiE
MTVLDSFEAAAGGDSRLLLLSVPPRGRRRRGMKRRRSDRDQRTYEDPQVVARYGRTRELQAPEQTLFDELGPELARMDMLDLGVGAGRTAWFFAPRAKTYLGLDYARTMIERCNRDLPAYKFVVGDACHLDFATDNSYDFVLFSYNGIDHLELPEREHALIEMKRVLRPGGVMAFSGHNANFLPVVVDNYRFRLRVSALETARSLKRTMVFNFHNPTLRFRLPLDVGMVRDGLHAFRSSGVCYIRPDLQVAALARLGMTDIRCAMNDSARFLDGGDPQVATFASPWVYYRCRKPEQAG